ncbi:MAG: hypothetical protein Q9214_007328, partial [Letrouitia sp. 1 TL-2023]
REDRLSSFYQFEHHALTSPNIQAIWSRAGTYTFAQAYDLSCKYGNWYLSLGIRPGDFVALYLQNSPDLLFAWIGLWSIGAAPAMINWNLGGEGLMHCLNISKAKLLICDERADLRDRIEGVQTEISANKIRLEFLDGTLRGAIAQGDGSRPRDELRRGFTRTSPMALLYTSMVAAGGVAHKLYGQRQGPDGDRWYICMPLYHGTGAISTLTALITGCMVAIGKGFSVRNFWNDVRDSESTIFVYVGETLRYLLAASPSPLDKEHKVRLAWGNGLRPDVWKKFQDRFGVPEIGEFFSSTEGMLTFRTWSRGDYLTNTVGHHGALLRLLTRKTQVPVANDHSTGEVQRDPSSGLAKRVSYEEGGEILVKVPDESSFLGYLGDHEASQKRFVRDILSKGDLYFRSGDALRRTKDGRWSFLDRLGDTYRWKGENVSTTEVAEVLGRYPGILEANVYGVLVPHTDGRAGCAAVVIAPEQKDRFDWERLVS